MVLYLILSGLIAAALVWAAGKLLKVNISGGTAVIAGFIFAIVSTVISLAMGGALLASGIAGMLVINFIIGLTILTASVKYASKVEWGDAGKVAVMANVMIVLITAVFLVPALLSGSSSSTSTFPSISDSDSYSVSEKGKPEFEVETYRITWGEEWYEMKQKKCTSVDNRVQVKDIYTYWGNTIGEPDEIHKNQRVVTEKTETCKNNLEFNMAVKNIGESSFLADATAHDVNIRVRGGEFDSYAINNYMNGIYLQKGYEKERRPKVDILGEDTIQISSIKPSNNRQSLLLFKYDFVKAKIPIEITKKCILPEGKGVEKFECIDNFEPKDIVIEVNSKQGATLVYRKNICDLDLYGIKNGCTGAPYDESLRDSDFR